MRPPETVKVQLPDARCSEIALLVKRVPRSKRVRLVVTRTGAVELRLPLHVALEPALDFARTQSCWISKQLAALPTPCALSHFLHKQGWISLQGQRRRLYWQQEQGAGCIYFTKDQSIAIPQFPASTADSQLATALRSMAAQALPERLAELAQRHAFRYQRCTVRNQRSRWGSCSSRKTISLNWKLLLLEPQLQDYVLWHELCHLRQMNHSAAFWAELESVCPGAKKLDRQLSDEGSRILNLLC